MKPSDYLKFSRELWQHQKDDLDRFAGQNEVGLLWRPGTGKTTEAIGLLRVKYNQAKQVLPTLVISPVVTLPNWQKEFQLNASAQVADSTVILDGSEKNRLKILQYSDAKIFIMNPEGLEMESVVHALAKKNLFAVVVDEAHRFKAPKLKTGSKTGKPSRLARLLYLGDQPSVRFRMIMTGTLIANSYLDIWAPFRFLDLGATFSDNFYVFRETYFHDKNASWKGNQKYFPKWVPKPGIEELITKKLAEKCSYRHEDDVLTLPPVVEKRIYAKLGKEQEKAYTEMYNELVTSVRAGTCAATNALAKTTRLLQILSGYVPVSDMETCEETIHVFKDNPLLDALEEQLAEITPHRKVIVWACYAPQYKMIIERVKKLGLEFAELTGRTKDKQAEIDRFQNNPLCRVMIGNAKAGGVGIGLQQSSCRMYYDCTHSLIDREQANARDRRGGSEIHENIYQIDFMQERTLSEDVRMCLIRKDDFARNILDRLKSK